MKINEKNIGKRLREIRNIANEGTKLSANQFAHLLDETRDKILNYENGRASVSIKLLINLYYRGFSPVYILTGEGSIFADNEAGISMRKKLEKRADKEDREETGASVPIDELIREAAKYNVAAGNILKEISKRKGEH